MGRGGLVTAREDWSKAVTVTDVPISLEHARGFVIEFGGDRYMLTAAHCLPNLPPAHAASYTEERTFRNILGPLGGKPTISAECLFVDPVADIAVLGQPDNQALYDEADAYDDLVNSAVPMPIGGLTFTRKQPILPDGTSFPGRPEAEADAFLLALDGHWFPGRVRSSGRTPWLETPAEPVEGGMSGSPIATPDGRAIGLVSTNELYPLLMDALPGWLLRQVEQMV